MRLSSVIDAAVKLCRVIDSTPAQTGVLSSRCSAGLELSICADSEFNDFSLSGWGPGSLGGTAEILARTGAYQQHVIVSAIGFALN